MQRTKGRGLRRKEEPSRGTGTAGSSVYAIPATYWWYGSVHSRRLQCWFSMCACLVPGTSHQSPSRGFAAAAALIYFWSWLCTSPCLSLPPSVLSDLETGPMLAWPTVFAVHSSPSRLRHADDLGCCPTRLGAPTKEGVPTSTQPMHRRDLKVNMIEWTPGGFVKVNQNGVFAGFSMAIECRTD